MKRFISVVLLLGISISGILFGSEVKLIEPAEAIRLVGNKSVIFVSGDSNETYTKNHIIGSVEMYADNLYQPDVVGDMQCYKKALLYIQSKGIKNNQMIITYDNFYGSNAAAVHSFFESLGHKEIRVLNGGVESIRRLDPNQQVYDKLKAQREMIKKDIVVAQKEGRVDEVEKFNCKIEGITAKMDMLEPKLLVQCGKEEIHKKSDYQLDPTKFNVKYIADKDEVKKAIEDIIENGESSRFIIIDTCNKEEIAGEEKIDNVLQHRETPKVKFIEWRDITDIEKKRSFKSLKEMQQIFDKEGISRDQTIYVYCRSSVGSSSHVSSALRLLGYEKVKLFTGSCRALSSDMNLSIER
ncbi:MAG: rhodanese-like domain-containing protein [Campylobacterota bacterium]|nr:rhodanese-like domain-containing protein [Campylobacterota bacterium]